MNNTLSKMLLALLFSLPLIGCEQEGPAERAGEEIDEAVEEAGETLEEAGEAIEETGDDIREKTES